MEYLISTQTVQVYVAHLIVDVLRKTILSLLRVCINLTNATPEICEFLNSDGFLSAELTKVITADTKNYTNTDHLYGDEGMTEIQDGGNEKREARFELLLLTLGLMINFVQESNQVKESVIASSQASSILSTFEQLRSKKVSDSANRAHNLGTRKPRPWLPSSPRCSLTHQTTKRERCNGRQRNQAMG